MLRLLVTVWGCEIILARTSSLPQAPLDLVESALGLALLTAAAGLGSAAIPGTSGWRPIARALVLVTPAVFVALGIVAPVAVSRGALGLSVTACLAGGAALWRGARAWRGGDPLPSPWFALALLSIAAAAAWTLQQHRFPPAEIPLTAAVLAIAMTFLASRQRTVPLAIAATVTVALWPAAPPAIHWPPSPDGPAPSAPDIILLSVDTLRADAVGEMESYRKLASQGVRFEQVQAESPWTLPSMGTLLTGAPFGKHGAGRLEPGHLNAIAVDRTLASRLSQHGYDTAAVLARNPYVGREFGFDRGFAIFDCALDIGRHALPKARYRWGIGRPVVARLLMLAGLGERPPAADAEFLVTRAIHILEHARNRPLFLWIHFLDSHLPYVHAAETALPWRRRMTLDGGRGLRAFIDDPHWASEAGRRQLRTAYRNEVRHIDGAIGRLLEYLELDSKRERVIVLTSDHGEEFFEHGGFEHGHALFQEVASVPLVIANLGGERSPGSIEASVVGHIDVVPTLLEIAGIPDPSLPGQNLASAIHPRTYVTQNLLYGDPDQEQFSVRRRSWKAIVGPGDAIRLYDLDRDPGETRDIARERPQLAQRLAAQPRGLEPQRWKPAEIDDALRESLRALGYIVED